MKRVVSIAFAFSVIAAPFAAVHAGDFYLSMLALFDNLPCI